MQILITFLEGILSFLSPCMLPMLPLYLTYFAGHAEGEEKKRRATVVHALAFVLGFTVVFSLLGVFAGVAGVFLARHRAAVNAVCGVVVILMGLSVMEIIPLPFFRGMKGGVQIRGFFSAFLFGAVYSVSLTPCVGAFLGSALMLASSAGSVRYGFLLLFVYSLGLGIPFVLAAVMIDRLRSVFGWVKRHYRAFNIVCGCFLVLLGIAMAFGWMNRLMAVLS